MSSPATTKPIIIMTPSGTMALWQRGEGQLPRLNLGLLEIFLVLNFFSVGRKGIFTLKSSKPGWTQQSKVVSECSAFWSAVSLGHLNVRLKTMSGLTSVKVVFRQHYHIKVLVATLDSYLNMGPHTFAIGNFPSLVSITFLPLDKSVHLWIMAVSVAFALVSSRFYYANSVYLGCPRKHRAVLSEQSRHLARVVTQQSSRSPSLTSTELLRQLHWLHMEWRTNFKLVSLTFKALHTGHPPYLADLSQYQKPTLEVHALICQSPTFSSTAQPFIWWISSRAFHISAPKIWNSLPPLILQSQTFSSFRRYLYVSWSYLYGEPILPRTSIPNASWFFSEMLALCKSLT